MADTPMKLATLFGNPDQIFSPSIYANIMSDRETSSVHQNLIRINGGARNGIQGLLNSPLRFNVNANWDNAGVIETVTSNGMLKSIYDYTTTVMGYNGLADPTNLGLSSQLIYKNSGYLEFDVSFRVIDWKGNGDPILAAYILNSMCTPTSVNELNGEQLVSLLKDMALNTADRLIEWLVVKTGKTEAQAKQISDAFDKDVDGIITGLKKVGGAIKGAVGGAVSALAGNAVGGVVQDIFTDPQFFVIASSPSPVKVEIGTYFNRSDLVVKAVSSEFSKECTQAGPIYADFGMSFSSRRALLRGSKHDYEGIGLTLTHKNRVSRKGLTQQKF